uniref:Ubiquitinyl hydrolase 1 n=1 Tax=Caenorhabditis tropicalis TaxID=1561998 RepID=A0A1I7SXL3_9PELO
VFQLYYDGGLEKMVSKESREATLADRKLPFEKSAMFQILDRKCFSTVVKVRLPSQDEIDKARSTSTALQGPSWKETVAIMCEEDKQQQQQQLVGKSQLMADYMQKTTPEFFYNRDPPKNLRVALNEDSISVSESETLVASTSSSHPISLRLPKDSTDGRIVRIQSHDGYHKLDVDSRMHLIEFKTWVADQLKMDKDQFVIVKHSTDDGSDTGYETNLQDDVTVSNAFQSCFISIKPRAPLKHNEKMMQIVLFEMHELQKDNWRPLFELPVSQTTLVGDVLLQCLRMYKEVYGDDLPLKMVRLREVFSSGIGTGQRSLLNLNTPLDKRGYNWNSPMYLQIFGDQRIIGKPGNAVMVRQFRPSTVEIGPVEEVLFDAQAENPVLSFLEAVSRRSRIPVERVAVIEPKEYNWSEWPYLKSRLEMLESRSQK